MQTQINEVIGLIREGKAGAAISCLEKLSQPRNGRPLLTSPQAVADCCQDMKLLEHEEMHVLLLDAKNKLIKRIMIARGTVDMARIFPREIFRQVLLVNASGFMVVHNHPSGEPAPSPEDDKLTRTIGEGARLLEIRFIDHLIIGDSYYSYMEERKL